MSTVAISYLTAMRARAALSKEFGRVSLLLEDAKKTIAGFAPTSGSIEYWTAQSNEISTALAELNRAMEGS